VIDPRAILEETDWDSLHHAYGPASDAPEALLGLLSEDPDTCGGVLGYLDAAVLHQGTLYPVTAPVALYVAGILGDPRTLIRCESALPWDERERPLRAALLEWLGSVAESTAWYDEDLEDDDLEDEEDEEDEEEGDEGEDSEEEEEEEKEFVAQCRAIRRELYLAVDPYQEDADDSIRRAAAGAMANLMVAPELTEFREEQAVRMQRAALDAPAIERAGAALTLGKWGLVPQQFLTDADPSVRAAAALAPALDTDPAALEEVKRALLDPAGADAWFTEFIPQLNGRFRFALVAALLRRTSSYAEIRDQALAVARMTNAYTVESDWGPLLERAFPQPYEPGRPFTDDQREFLRAIVANEECWGSVANPWLWFRRAGLPFDRDELDRLVQQY
jgi:hypothetical protein